MSKQSAKMFSFKNGMKVLPEAIASELGNRVSTNVEVTSVRKTGEGNYGVTFRDGNQNLTLLADIVLSTVPAYKAAELFGHFDENLNKHLNEIYYPPVLVLYLIYNCKDVGQPLDGFGFLIPEKEDKSFLGAIWSSVIFPNRSDESKAAFTLFIGGSRDAGFVDDVEQLVMDRARREFELIMKISAEPVSAAKRFWPKAIPQYNLGYVEHENFFDHFENANRGIFLGGNYRGGISVGDCIKNAELVFQRIKNLT
jgi:oxygen-dependent protoporphyrinogen oxidase